MQSPGEPEQVGLESLAEAGERLCRPDISQLSPQCVNLTFHTMRCCSGLPVLRRVNVDFKNNTVRPVALLSSPMDPDKLPPTQMFVVEITEVRVHTSNNRHNNPLGPHD